MRLLFFAVAHTKHLIYGTNIQNIRKYKIYNIRVSIHLISRNGKLEGEFADLLGFEPRQTDPESVVLPLHHKSMDILRPQM